MPDSHRTTDAKTPPLSGQDVDDFGHVLSEFTAALPGEQPDNAHVSRQVFEECYSYVDPTPTSSPSLVACSEELAADLGFDSALTHSNTFVDVFSGNAKLNGMKPYAMCYGGHQFGHWAGQLGDGRAINLGERISKKMRNPLSLQLKGAGPTPYSRHADGRAVLRSSLREYMCSEAMHYLGVPTTRALSIMLTGDRVERDMFYDGHAEFEPGAIVCRVSESFLRFGSFEIFSSRQDYDRLDALMAFTLRKYYPACFDIYKKKKTDGILAFFETLVDKSALMVSEWMRVGFVHGVMNTDNMSILGETIDYGPYGWLDNFDRDWTPNTTDREHRRYRYSAQPGIVQWNLLQLANAIYPLINEELPLENAVRAYSNCYNQYAASMMANKLGLSSFSERDEKLVQSLEDLMQSQEMDFTAFYTVLTDLDLSQEMQDTISDAALLKFLSCTYLNGASETYYSKLEPKKRLSDFSQFQVNSLRSWLNAYLLRRRSDENVSAVAEKMGSANPRIIPRNFIVQEVISAAHLNDYSPLDKLMSAIKSPYENTELTNAYQRFRPQWALQKPGCSTLSCSS